MKQVAKELEFVDDYEPRRSRQPVIFGEWRRLFPGHLRYWVLIGLPVGLLAAWGIAVMATSFI